MKGILVVNKPKGVTSRDVVNKVSKILNEKKMGHTGTLDPIATGVLVLVMGRFTKLVEELTSLDKEYLVCMQLGILTDTGDITGRVIDKCDKKIDIENINKVFNSFPKEYEQIVPKYSAVKINGKKLYEYSREGIDIELPKRIVHIYSLDLIDYKDNIITFKTKVSKGTYIRSLIIDIAKYLNTVATLKELTRTKQGIFHIKDSYTLEDIENNSYKLLDIKDIFDYQIINIDVSNEKKFKNGNKINMDVKDGKYFILDNNEIIAIYEFNNQLGRQIVRL